MPYKDFVLSEQEREFATEHHDLVLKFLSVYKLGYDEWYDIVVPRYLRAVYRWLREPGLQRYKFSTVAFSNMKSAVSNEMNKRKKRIQTISLDGYKHYTDSTYADIITYKNLDFIYNA